jgi:hypothetical protein
MVILKLIRREITCGFRDHNMFSQLTNHCCSHVSESHDQPLDNGYLVLLKHAM